MNDCCISLNLGGDDAGRALGPAHNEVDAKWAVAAGRPQLPEALLPELCAAPVKKLAHAGRAGGV